MIEAGLVGAKIHIGEVEMAPQAKEKFGDDHAAYETALRLALVRAIADAVALEKAITESDTDAAAKARDTLGEAMTKGHDAFQPQEEDEGPRPGGPGPRRGGGEAPGR